MAEKMTKVQQLGVLTALQKMVKAKADQLRKEVNAEMAQDYLSNKSGKDRPVLLDGIKVGNIVMSIDEKYWEVTDPIDYEAFLFESGQMNETWSLNPAYTLEAMRRLGDDYRYIVRLQDGAKGGIPEVVRAVRRCGSHLRHRRCCSGRLAVRRQDRWNQGLQMRAEKGCPDSGPHRRPGRDAARGWFP